MANDDSAFQQLKEENARLYALVRELYASNKGLQKLVDEAQEMLLALSAKAADDKEVKVCDGHACDRCPVFATCEKPGRDKWFSRGGYQ